MIYLRLPRSSSFAQHDNLVKQVYNKIIMILKLSATID